MISIKKYNDGPLCLIKVVQASKYGKTIKCEDCIYKEECEEHEEQNECNTKET